jgi:hypothetical protein
MGGNLAWTLRLSDGTEYRMDRWTNAMSELITNPLFYQEDKSHIDACLESWLGMKEDWEKNQDTGNFEHNMTKVYAPYPYGMKPSEYGIVVTDFINKVLLTNQQYTSFDVIDVYWLTLGEREFFMRMYPERYENIMKFVQGGLVRKYSYFARSKKAVEYLHTTQAGWLFDKEPRDDSMGDWVEVCLPGTMTFEQIEQLFDDLPKDIKDDVIMGRAVLDTAPFTVEEYNPTSDGWTDMLARVRELGFTLSDDEIAAWEARIAQERENEAEDA